jgi:EmrB/QacA subfamily drug resistance transporter
VARVRAELKDPEVAYRRRWMTLTVLCISLMVIGLDNTILNVALPTLSHAKNLGGLGASGSALQWIVDAYTLVFAGLLLTMGSLGDRFGRYKFLTFGLVVFGTGSVMSAFAPSAGVLIATRSLMGIGGACIMPGTLSILSNVFRSPAERAKAIGVWAGVSALGVGIGPVAGGALLTHFWWGSVFLVNVPVCMVALVAGYFLLPRSRDPNAPRLDPLGAILSILGLVLVLWAIIQAPTEGWTDPSVVLAFFAGVVVLICFVAWELHTDHPMLDVRFFENRRFTAANIAITMTFFALFGSLFLITQYLQTVLGFSALEAGIRMLPMACVMLVVAPLAPRIVERVGTKLVVGTGLLLVTAGMAWASAVPTTDGYLHLVVAMVMLSGGMGLIMAPATESIMGSLPPAKAGVGSAMNDTTRQMGGALGVAIIGSILATSYRPGVTDALTALGAPANVITQAQDSVAGAVQAASTLPAGLGDAVATAAKSEFVDAFGGALIIASCVVLVAAVIVFLFLPARAHDARESVEGPLDGLASLTFAEAEGVLEDDAEHEATVLAQRSSGSPGT